MTTPRLLDLFSCSGGAGMGYHLAGFEVTGVDIAPQPRYPFMFHQADALEYLAEHGHEFDVIHASPPCQSYSPLNAYNGHDYPDLVDEMRDLLRWTGRPYVMENVPQAPLLDPVTLCGPMFGLGLYRHRDFETGNGFTLPQLPHAEHVARCARNGYLPTAERPFMSIHGGKHSRAWQRAACEAMGTPWLIATDNVLLSIREVCEAIPPAYTEWIGARLLEYLDAEAAA